MCACIRCSFGSVFDFKDFKRFDDLLAGWDFDFKAGKFRKWIKFSNLIPPDSDRNIDFISGCIGSVTDERIGARPRTPNIPPSKILNFIFTFFTVQLDA